MIVYECLLFFLALVLTILHILADQKIKDAERRAADMVKTISHLRILLDSADKENQLLSARIAAKASFDDLQEDEKTQAAIDAADMLRKRAVIHERIKDATRGRTEG